MVPAVQSLDRIRVIDADLAEFCEAIAVDRQVGRLLDVDAVGADVGDDGRLDSVTSWLA